MVDTLGLPVMITVTAGDVRDEISARDLLWRLRLTHPQLTQVWADSAYARHRIPQRPRSRPCNDSSVTNGHSWYRSPVHYLGI